MIHFFALFCISCFCPPKATTIGAVSSDQSRAHFEFYVKESLGKLTTVSMENAEKLKNLEKHMKHLEHLEQLQQLANLERCFEKYSGLHLPTLPVEPQPGSPNQLGTAIPLPPAIRFAAQMTEEVGSCCCVRRKCSRASAKECFINCPTNFRSFVYNHRASVTALICGLPFEILGLIAAYQQLKMFFEIIKN